MKTNCVLDRNHDKNNTEEINLEWRNTTRNETTTKNGSRRRETNKAAERKRRGEDVENKNNGVLDFSKWGNNNQETGKRAKKGQNKSFHIRWKRIAGHILRPLIRTQRARLIASNTEIVVGRKWCHFFYLLFFHKFRIFFDSFCRTKNR